MAWSSLIPGALCFNDGASVNRETHNIILKNVTLLQPKLSAKIFGLFSVCAKFFEKPISAQILCPVCCITPALPTQFSKRGLQILLLSRTEQFQYNPCSFALRMIGLMKQKWRDSQGARGARLQQRCGHKSDI